ncbi:leucine-rich repeat extensin-like protein 5 [Helianthus annuus]|uniref:leucine-rich repeat extensin-like protein 5 n=1 Tax=Helianthus annuus TaxID=4232 RepID=UPI000B9069F3|nr:leucine-rich repeat extensin-like protein 5 [Helianthus annuus]
MNSSPQEDWRAYLEPARRSVSLSSSPSYHHSFGPQSENEPNDSHHSLLPLQRSSSHRAFQDPTPYFQSRFNPENVSEEPMGHNPLGPEDHFPGAQDMDMDEDPDPEPAEPPTGTPTHPTEISDGSSFHGSPYRGPDSFAQWWSNYNWEYTPCHHSSPHQQVPSEDPHFEAVTPSPPPEQQPPPEPPRRRRSDPQMGGPSNPVSEVDSAPVAPPPPMGYDNPIPSYAGAAAYNPFEQPGYPGYNYYNAPAVDLYLEAANYNALHPEGLFQATYPTGDLVYGYQYPPPPQPLPQQQPQPP